MPAGNPQAYAVRPYKPKLRGKRPKLAPGSNVKPRAYAKAPGAPPKPNPAARTGGAVYPGPRPIKRKFKPRSK